MTSYKIFDQILQKQHYLYILPFAFVNFCTNNNQGFQVTLNTLTTKEDANAMNIITFQHKIGININSLNRRNHGYQNDHLCANKDLFNHPAY